MADQRLPELAAVTAPLPTDLLPCRQAADTRDKSVTRALLHTLSSGEHLVLPTIAEPLTPTLGFGDGDTGFYEGSANQLRLSIDGAEQFEWKMLSAVPVFRGLQGGATVMLRGIIATATVPNHVFNNDPDTGLGLSSADHLSLIAGGVEGIQVAETGVDATDQIIIFPGATIKGSAATPSLAFGDGNTGFYESGDNTLVLVTSGTDRFVWSNNGYMYGAATDAAGIRSITPTATQIGLMASSGDTNTGIGHAGSDAMTLIAGALEVVRVTNTASVLTTQVTGEIHTANAAGGAILDEAASATNPTIIAHRADPLTGLGATNAGELHLIANSITGLTLKELNGGVLQAPQASIAITAFAGGGQGSAVTMWGSYNVVTVCATAGDSIKLAASFSVNSVTHVKNDGAEACDVFPGTGDDLGLGVNVAYSLAAGASISFIGTAASTTWTEFHVPGSGDVAKVGTPVDNQIGVWTGDGTLEGEANITWTGVLNLGGAILMNITGGPRMQNLQGTATVPNLLPNKSDVDTGMGYVSNDVGNLVAGGVSVASFYELGGHPKLIIDQSDAGTGLPTLVFGSTAAEGFKGGSGTLSVMTGSNTQFRFVGTSFRANLAGGGAIENVVASATVPSVRSNSSDVDSGLGAPTLDQVCLIAGGVQGLQVKETGVDATDQVIIFPGATIKGAAGTPSLAFGDGNTGFYESSDNVLECTTAGVDRFTVNDNGILMAATAAGAIRNTPAGDVTPTLLPANNDFNTGIGQGTADALSLIAGGREAIRIYEASNYTLIAYRVNGGLTADVSSIQGGGVILSSHNQYSTVGTTGDAATLPAVFVIGTEVHVYNDGANSMDVFPASGDDAGAGADTAVAVAAGARATFFAITANSTWITTANA